MVKKCPLWQGASTPHNDVRIQLCSEHRPVLLVLEHYAQCIMLAEIIMHVPRSSDLVRTTTGNLDS